MSEGCSAPISAREKGGGGGARSLVRQLAFGLADEWKDQAPLAGPTVEGRRERAELLSRSG